MTKEKCARASGEKRCTVELAQDHKVSQMLGQAFEVFPWECVIRNAF